MSAGKASPAHRRLLIFAVFFPLALAWGPSAAAQLPECPLDLICLDPDLAVPAPVPAPTPGEDPVGTIEETIEETVDKLKQPVAEAVETVEKTAGDPAGSVPALPGDSSGGSSDGRSAPPPGAAGGDGFRVPRTGTLLAREMAHELGAATAFEAGGVVDVRVTATQSSSAGEAGPTSRVGQIVTDIAKLAFPLGLALLVGGFLLVQHRLDHRDPKLAHAPKDAHDRLLSFE